MREVKKFKARLNIDGLKMRPGVKYDLTYAPVASWMFVQLLIALSALNGWHTKQMDYVLAFLEQKLHFTPAASLRGSVEIPDST